ncbi:hypothetical protein PHISCL_04427 [Aspergillus sclerotialis]|uniref:Uncharacterized protein n=1 Tax=Aspergillus sclerotialis TaxID=2070753 RepID=A0A3A2ZLP6_9EURO|nr:hypothetical protein PHISCL_04427 [Aspergillus sclerotialis]
MSHSPYYTSQRHSYSSWPCSVEIPSASRAYTTTVPQASPNVEATKKTAPSKPKPERSGLNNNPLRRA